MTPKLIKLNSAKTAAVNRAVPWIPIDENTPRGVKLLLINKRYGVAVLGPLSKEHTFTHWQALPYFSEELENDI